MADKESSPARQAWRIEDARGRSVAQLDPVMMHLLHQPGVIPPAALREIAQQIGIGWNRAHRIAFWVGLVGLVACGIGLTISLVRLSTGGIRFGEFVRNLVPFSGVWVGPFGIWIGTRQVRFKRVAGVMLRHRRCPHCGYDLRGLPRAPGDGTTVCPECGCAWRLDGAAAVDPG